ncbi:serine/threonine-protein kinase [Agromyces sp. SYSU T0242]|uniref:serine/threonine-protein kinase n=1 Tax=Agromyces litoreus TaxID=3158561 RepID=UPI00339B9C28
MMQPGDAEPPILPGSTHLGLLGSGGSSDVHLYQQELPSRLIAVKVLRRGVGSDRGDDAPAGADQAARARFAAEANHMARLSAHPFVVTVLQAGETADGRPYLAMEHCPGPSLSERCRDRPFGIEEALRTGVRLADALATAHAAGILHRDLKPANVLTNVYGWPVLTDFGLSTGPDAAAGGAPRTLRFGRLDDEPDAATGWDDDDVGVSVPWSPPEAFRSEPSAMDARSDVFSLAATLHTLLAGRSPFEVPGEPNGPSDLVGRIRAGLITPIDRDDLPAGLPDVLARAMAIRPDDRYRSAEDFGRALQRVQAECGFEVTTLDVAAPERNAVSAGPDATDVSGAVAAAQPAGPAAEDDETPDPTTNAPHDTAAPPPASPDDGTRPPAAVPPADARPAVPRRTGVEGVERVVPVRPPRARAGLVAALSIGAAVLLIVAAAAAAILHSGALAAPVLAWSSPGASSGDIVSVVPAPRVQPGTISNGRVVFEVDHDDARVGDRYRWHLVDDPGPSTFADGPDILVDRIPAGRSVCIEVRVDRDGRTSDPVTACATEVR